MAEEIEVKFLNIDHAKMEAKLAEIGAKKVAEFFYRMYGFDYPDWRMDKEGAWLRIRTDGNETTMAYKKRLGVKGHGGETNDEGMEEIEIVVSDFEVTRQLVLALGFTEKHYVEKKRVRWVKDRVEFDIDLYPGLKPFIEIEAESWERIDEAIGWLGLNPADKKIFSGNQIYALEGIKVADYVRMAFDGLVKREK